MQSKIDEHIARLLNAYATDIKLHGKFNWTSEHVHAEYFFKQLLNLIYDWELIHTSEEKQASNTEAIDLFSQKQQFALQVTAQSSNFADKIEKTVSLYKEKWQNEFPKLKILFASTSFKEPSKEFMDSSKLEIISIEGLISIIEGCDHNKKSQIYNFLLYALTSYNSHENPLTCISSFQDAKKRKELNCISSTFYEEHNLLYYNEIDYSRCSNIIKAYEQGKRNTLISGPPCTGKTTFIFLLQRRLEDHLIKTFYMDILQVESLADAKRNLDQLLAHDYISCR